MGFRRNGIHISTVEVMDGSGSYVTSINTDDIHKWHNRLAHVSVKWIKFLNNKDVFGKNCLFDIPFCDHCVL